MAFRNSILAGEELVRSGIRSENYVPGVAGWRIGRDGTAEFLDVTTRGRVVATGGVRIERFWYGGVLNPEANIDRAISWMDPADLDDDTGVAPFTTRIRGEYGISFFDPDAPNIFDVEVPSPGTLRDGLVRLRAPGGLFVGGYNFATQFAVPPVIATDAAASGGAVPLPVPDSGAAFAWQGGRTTTTVPSGDFHEVAMPDAFANGLVAFTAAAEVGGAGPGYVMTPTGGSSTAAILRFRLWNATTGAKLVAPINVVWMALGF